MIKSLILIAMLCINVYSYVAAAELLVQSTEPFEAIVLKFLKHGACARNGLKRYLELKLSKMINSGVFYNFFFEFKDSLKTSLNGTFSLFGYWKFNLLN